MSRNNAAKAAIRRKRRATRPRAQDIMRSVREPRAKPATRPATGYDMAHDNVETRLAWAQCDRLVRGGWVKVCTWCTQPNFDLVHCFQSLFGTMFMNTVHEHYSRGFQKKKSNQIK